MNRWIRFLLVLLAVAAALPAQAFAQAMIEGKVQLPKPVAPAVSQPRYPNQTVQPGPPDPPAAIVYLDGSFPAAAGGRPAKVAQKGLQFAPGLLAVRRGTTVEFPNEDDLYHNVFSYSKAKRFDLGRYRKDEKPASQLFDKPGVVRMSCEIHSHMQGVILVLDTPYFVKTEADGSYRLQGLPAGKYILRAWVSEKQAYERPVDLTSGGALRVDFPSR
jgi:plastocyanin